MDGENATGRDASMTPAQAQVINNFEGPMLVLAGPGSGKTRVVTHRIAHMLESGVSPRQILAITFTNKASAEMAERVEKLVPGQRLAISTFHKFCARMLRLYPGAVGLKPNFTILDTGDQTAAIRRAMHHLDLDTTHFPPNKILWRISKAKNDLITPEVFQRNFDESIGNHWDAVVSRVYPEYQKVLLQNNSVDFDDLLVHVAVLLTEFPELRDQLDERFRYVLVDEYQDTNQAQYRIVVALSQTYRNLCATGDPDQSIYGWRGARIENILRFENDFPDVKVVRLEQNFRSTKSILAAADQLIAKNIYRKAKTLVTDNVQGVPVRLIRFSDGYREADLIAEHMKAVVASGKRTWSDFAMLYRVNSLSQPLEVAFQRAGVPYQIVAGMPFWEREEIKDLVAYLRVLANPDDDLALRRIVNKPQRGLGAKSQDRIFAWARVEGLTPMEALEKASSIPQLSKKAALSAVLFAKIMNGLDLAKAGSVAELLREVVKKTGITIPWLGSGDETDLARLTNVEQLIAAAEYYDKLAGEERTLEGFLETTSLASDLDNVDEKAGKVTLMTLHAAKGLEFPVVFVCGVEENLIPHERSINSGNPREIEEERRLLFVGMTRAKEVLYLTEASVRSIHGRSTYTIPSSFTEPQHLSLDRLSEFEFQAMTFDPNSFQSKRPTTAVEEFGTFEGEDGDGDEFEDREPGVSKRRSKPAFSSANFSLTTAADLLAGNNKSIEIPTGFPVGSAVRHPRYGKGQVLSASGFGPRRTVTVEFEQGRTETFMVQKSPLQPLR
jgi:DNA helicase-2/ATP-dependent DNA helicase PcrA